MMISSRLIVDRLKPTDKEDYFKNISHDKKVLENFMCKYEEKIEDFDFSPHLSSDCLFAIRLKENERFIGIISLFSQDSDSIEIGYGLGQEYWGKGYTKEACVLILEYLFLEKGYKTVYASYFAINLASKRVMEKLGMVYSHTVMNELTYLGIERDAIYYKMDKDLFLKLYH